MMKLLKNIVKILAIMLMSIILLSKIEVQASDVLNNASEQASKQEISMFNEEFKSNLGENVSGVKIKSLISAIKASNENNQEHKVWVNSEGNLPEISEYKNSEKYNASVKSYDDEGRISIISIELSSGSTVTPSATSTPSSGITISPNSTPSPKTTPTPKTTPSPTTLQSKLPQTGIEDYTWVIIAVIVFTGLAIFTYKKIRDYKDIK